MVGWLRQWFKELVREAIREEQKRSEFESKYGTSGDALYRAQLDLVSTCPGGVYLDNIAIPGKEVKDSERATTINTVGGRAVPRYQYPEVHPVSFEDEQNQALAAQDTYWQKKQPSDV